MKKELLRATHEGQLKIGDAILDVAVLENGQRIITQAAVFRALDRPARGNARVINIPTFMDAKNLQPLISQELMAVINKVEYLDRNKKKQQGYDADILPLVSDLYLLAREKGLLLPSQMDTAKKAEMLVRSLARVAIVSLIDEATGYQEVREKDALQKFLQKFLEEEKGKWVKTFPDEFFEALFKMRGLSWEMANKGRKPQYIGHDINNFVYSRLAPQVLTELRTRNPKDEDGRRKGKHTQWIDVDFGHPKLKEHLSILIALAKASGHSFTGWKRMVERALPKFEQDGTQSQEIPFEEV